MEIFLVIIVAFAFGWYIGNLVTTITLAMSFRQILNDLGVKNSQLRKLAQDAGVQLPEEPAVDPAGNQLTPLEIVLEQHQGVLYAYRKDNSQFLGQGTDRASLIESISRRMTDVRLIIDQEDGADLLQKRNS